MDAFLQNTFNVNTGDLWNILVLMCGEPLANTLLLFGFTLLFSLPLGLVFAFGRMARFKPVQWLTRVYLLVMRGTPLMLQLLFFWFGLNLGAAFTSWGWVDSPTSRLLVAIVTFSLNYSAYFAEIYRGGIEGIPKGQREAARVLGFSRGQTFRHIVLPQVIKRILPPMGNEFMTLVKDTSLAQIIAVLDISLQAKKLQPTYVSIAPFIVAGVFYLVMNSIVSKGFSVAEKKLSYYQ